VDGNTNFVLGVMHQMCVSIGTMKPAIVDLVCNPTTKKVVIVASACTHVTTHTCTHTRTRVRTHIQTRTPTHTLSLSLTLPYIHTHTSLWCRLTHFRESGHTGREDACDGPGTGWCERGAVRSYI
jgi:hypothetical protein